MSRVRSPSPAPTSPDRLGSLTRRRPDPYGVPRDRACPHGLYEPAVLLSSASVGDGRARGFPLGTTARSSSPGLAILGPPRVVPLVASSRTSSRPGACPRVLPHSHARPPDRPARDALRRRRVRYRPPDRVPPRPPVAGRAGRREPRGVRVLRHPVVPARSCVADRQALAAPRPDGARARIPAAFRPGDGWHVPPGRGHCLPGRSADARMANRGRGRGAPDAPRDHGNLRRVPPLLSALVRAGAGREAVPPDGRAREAGRAEDPARQLTGDG